MKSVLTALLFCLLGSAFPQSSPKSIEQELGSKYRDRVLVLRSFYRTESLHFDSRGKLISKGETGYGPTDGSIHAAAFHFANHQLTIRGDLPVPIYDEKTGKLTYNRGFTKREVVLDLLDPLDAATVDAALWTVFYKPGERPLPPCSAEGAEAFRQSLLLPGAPKPKADEGSASKPPIAVCFPNGEVAPRLRQGANEPHGKVTPPHARYDPEPDFPELARKRGQSGEVVLSMIVDSFGRPSTIVITKPLGNGFDENAAKTVHTWRFDPGKADGNPTPVAVTVEVAFHLGN